MNKKKIAILGAGPMGLAAAYHLSKENTEISIFEKDDCVGGMSASFDFDGVTIEKFYHFINLPDSDLFELLKELNLYENLRWTDTKMGFFRSSSKNSTGKGELHVWGNPLALFRLPNVPLITKIRYGFHAFMCKFIKDLTPLDTVPADEWFTRWEGKQGYNIFWKPLFEKKFFELASPLSAAWIASRIRRVANSRKSIMQEQLGYLEGGSQILLDTLVEKIEKKGHTIFLNSSVEKIEKKENNFNIYTNNEVHINQEFDIVISTIPLPYINKIISFLPQDYKHKLDQINNIGVACALFRFAKPITQNFWLNIDMPDWDIPGIIEYSNLCPMKSAYVYVPFYMPHTHANWHEGDETLLAKACKYIAEINPEVAKTEENACVFRYEYAQPVCPPHFFDILPSYVSGVKGLYIADTTHSFPEDRSIQESAKIAKELSKFALS